MGIDKIDKPANVGDAFEGLDLGETVEHLPLPGCATSTPERITTIEHGVDISPVEGQPPSVNFMPNVVNAPSWVKLPKDPTWVTKEACTRKYIDDGLTVVKLHMKAQALLNQDGKLYKNPHVAESQRILDTIAKNAESRGMKVNREKTTIVAVSSALGYEATAHLRDTTTGKVIEGVKKMNCLGFTIDCNGGVWSQVEKLRGKLRQRVWLLRSAKRHGMGREDLIKMYKTRNV